MEKNDTFWFFSKFLWNFDFFCNFLDFRYSCPVGVYKNLPVGKNEKCPGGVVAPRFYFVRKKNEIFEKIKNPESTYTKRATNNFLKKHAKKDWWSVYTKQIVFSLNLV